MNRTEPSGRGTACVRPPDPLPDVLRAHAAALRAHADAIEASAARLESQGSADPAGRFASAKDNPLGTPRMFLDAGRRGEFPRFKRGREVVARWADVVAYIERRECKRKPRPRPSQPVTDDDRRVRLLIKAGVLDPDHERPAGGERGAP